MIPLFKFPSIGQFKETVTNMKKLNISENIVFISSPKMHGTNSGIGYSEKHGLWCQSHRRILTLENDNYNFNRWIEEKRDTVIPFMKSMASFYNIDLEKNVIILYGEFCGGKVQKNVALNGLDLMLVIFDVATATYEDCEKTEDVYLQWFDLPPPNFSFPTSIYNVQQFGTYRIEIGLDNKAEIQNKLVEMTNEVEKECPVGKYFGRVVAQDCTTGEGIVWRCSYKLENGSSQILRFKVKGKEHSTSKVKTMTGVNVEHINDMTKFVELSVTENRLNQGISEIFGAEDPDFKSLGKFNQWVIHDVKKEDMSAFPFLEDYEGKNGEEKQKHVTKLLNKSISQKCTEWFRVLMRKA